jgi:hypothetical protein
MEFAGHPDDLHQRLIGQPFEDYIQRTDIDFVFSDNAPVMDQGTGEYIDDDEEEGDTLANSIIDSFSEDELAAFIDRLTPAAMSGRIGLPHLEEYSKAVGQVLDYLQTDTLMMQNAVLKHGLANEPVESDSKV